MREVAEWKKNLSAYGEEEALVDSTNPQRRSGARAVATPPASNGGATRYSKILVSKAADATKATETSAKVSPV